MSWVHVARKDFADASRSKLLWILSVLMILLVAGISSIPTLVYTGDGPGPQFPDAMSFMFTTLTFMVSLIGLIAGYQAVVKERESGSIRVLLGLPNTRLDVVIGKVLGRAGVVAVPTIIGFVIGGIVIALLYDGFDISVYLSLLGFTLLLGVVYLSAAIGVSAAVSTRSKAVAGVLGIYLIFDWLWWAVPMGLYWFLNRELPGTTDLPTWYVLIERFGIWEPLHAIAVTQVDIAGIETVPTADRLAGEVPFYLETWFAWVFVAAWILVPLAIGYYRFANAMLE